MKKFFTSILFGVTAYGIYAHSIDFDKIEHWTGEGPNKAALVIQFGGEYEPSDAYVWGYRWQNEENPSGEDMVKAICADSEELVILTQYTGQYGSTLCGVGFGNAESVLDNLYFDFEMALEYPFITFDYFNNNSWFGQSDAPGENTPEVMQTAIDEARTTHVIQHPLDYFGYGYPAYDYDCWKMNPCGPDSKWQSGWYEGYWSFWMATGDKASDWLYSGTGFTEALLQNGTIHGWTFTQFEEAMVGGMGEGNPPTDDPKRISYRPAKNKGNAEVDFPTIGLNDIIEYYTLSGERLINPASVKGVVIMKYGNKTIKKIFK